MAPLNFPANPQNGQQYTANGKTWIYSSQTGAWAASSNLKVDSVAGKEGAVTLEVADVTGLTGELAAKAPLASPALTGTPTAPTATGGTNTTQIATTAFVQAAISTLQNLDADLTAISSLSGTGFLKRTGVDSWALDSNTYLTGNQSISVSGDATGSGTTSIALTLANSGVVAGTYGSSTAVPVVTVDAKGRVTGVTTSSISGSLTFTGDVTGSGATGSSTALTLANSGVVAGTYNDSATAVRPFTVDAKGRVTSIGTAVTITPSFASITGKPTTLSGYGITDAQALDADLTAIAALAGTSGFLKKTAADTWALDTNTYLTGNQSITVSGDASGSGTTSIALTLANSGVSAGTYTKVTVDAKGRVTTGASLASGDLPTYTGTISSSQVTTALGFTPENAANKAQANGYASLDGSGKVPSAQLPSYVDDVLEYANTAAFPATGETGKIYVTLDTNKTYRWSGSAYVEISASPGSTDAVTEGSTNLYFTNTRARNAISVSGSLGYNAGTGVISFTDAVTSVAGKTGAVTLTNSDVGLGNVENKSSATIRGELTSGNVTTALGYTPLNPVSTEWVQDDGTNGRLVFNLNTAQNTIYSASSGFTAWRPLRLRASEHQFWITDTSRLTLDGSGNLIGSGGETYLRNFKNVVGRSSDDLLHVAGGTSLAGTLYLNHNGGTITAFGATPGAMTVNGTANVLTSVIKQNQYVRHIEGKDWDTYSTAAGGLFLQYTSNLPVYIGSGAHVALHAGNYSSYALPLSGGTVTGTTNLMRRLKASYEEWHYEWGGGEDVTWRRIARIGSTDTSSWRGTSGYLVLYNENSNHGVSTRTEYHVKFAVQYSSNSSPLDNPQIVGSPNASTFVRLRKLGTRDYELQVRQVNFYQTMGATLQLDFNSGNLTAVEPSGVPPVGSAGVSDVSMGTFADNINITGNAETVTSITSSQVTTALGYTPYNATNPSGYITSSSLSSYLPLAGGTVTGTLLTTPGGVAMHNLADGNIGFGDASHSAGWGVSQALVARSGDVIWAFGSNGVTGNSDTLYLGIGSAANTTFATALSFTQNRFATFYNGLNVSSGALQQGGNQVLHAGNYSSYALPLGGGTVTGVATFNGGGANASIVIDKNIASPSNYWDGLQIEVRATSGTAGIGLHRNGYSHVGIYHDSSNELKFNMNSGTVTMPHNVGTVIGSGNYSSTLDGRYLVGMTNPASVTNFTISIGNNGSYSFVQSHSAQPLELNPVGNAVRIAGNTAIHAGNYNSYALPLSGGTVTGNVAVQTGYLQVISGSILASNAGTRGLIMDGNYTNGQFRHRWRKYDDGNGIPLYLDYAHSTADSYTAIARFGGGGTYRELEVYGALNATTVLQGGNQVVHAGNVSSYAVQHINGDSGAFNTNVSGQQSFLRFSTGIWAGSNPYPGNYSHILSFNAATDNRTFQLYFGDVPGHVYVRPNQGGSWHPWERILTSQNYSSYALPLSGGTLTGGLTGTSASFSSTVTTAGYVVASATSMSFGRNIVSGTNLNTDLESGGTFSSYGAADTSWNSPFPYGAVMAFEFTSGIRAQLGYDIRHNTSDYGNLWYRTKNNLGYSSWQVMLHSANYNSYSPTLTGGGASGTWGISISGNAATATTASQLGGVSASNYFRTDGSYPNSDFNTVVEGYWHIASGSANLPINQYGHRWDYDHIQNGQWVTQFYTATSDDQSMWVRQIRNYAPQTWRRMLDSANYSTYTSFNGSEIALTNGGGGRIQFYDGGNLGYRVRSASGGGWRWQFVDGGNGEYFGVAYPSGNTTINGSLTIGGNTAIHSGNYSSYALPLSGGTLSGDLTMANAGTSQKIIFGESTKAIYVSGYWMIFAGHVNEGWRFRDNNGVDRLQINGSSGSATFTGDVTAYSDIRVKRDIELITDAVAKVQQLRGVTFTRTDHEDTTKRHAGVIAQEVEQVLPEVVGEDEKGNKHVAYGNMVGLLIEAIKELKQDNDDLRARIARLEGN